MVKPANDLNIDYRKLVQQGYDRCAATYEAAQRNAHVPLLDRLIQRLPQDAHVLDIGCGSGVHVAQTIVQNCCVTGVDISGEQIRRARLNAPDGEFIQGDIMAMNFSSAQFDAVVALYSIFHLPREEHPELLRRIAAWLKPTGYLLASFSWVAEEAYTEDDFFDVTMYWSNYGLEDYLVMLSGLGFKVIEKTVIGTPPDQHPLVFAQI